MTREEEIQVESHRAVNKESIPDNNYIAFEKGFCIGAKWADQHSKEELVNVKKVEQWIIECFEFLNDAGHHNFKIDKFIENFKRAMEE